MSIDYCFLTKHLFESLGHVLDVIGCDGGQDRTDGIELPFGDHVITVKLDVNPREVYVSLADLGSSVCGADISTAGVTLLDDGFVLYAHIKSEQSLLKWLVKV